MLARSQRAATSATQPGPGADIDLLRTTLLFCQFAAEEPQHVPKSAIAAVLVGWALLGRRLGCCLWNRLCHGGQGGAQAEPVACWAVTVGAASPPTGNCSSTERRQVSANFSQSPSTFHLDVENARSHSPMSSAITRRRASPPLCLQKRKTGRAPHLPLEVKRGASVAIQGTKVQGFPVRGADRKRRALPSIVHTQCRGVGSQRYNGAAPHPQPTVQQRLRGCRQVARGLRCRCRWEGRCVTL